MITQMTIDMFIKFKGEIIFPKMEKQVVSKP